MRSTKFILIDTGSESNQIMMSDVGKMENGIQITKTYYTGNSVLDYIIRIHFSYAIAQRINLPGKEIWNKYCVLDSLTKEDGVDYAIIVVNNSIHRLSVKHLNSLQKRSNIHLFSLLLDPFDHLPNRIQNQILSVNWTKIFSFQKSDCIKCGFEYTDKIYSRVNLEKYSVNEDPINDIYFVGLAKDRTGTIYDIYKRLTAGGCKCDFTVIVDKKDLKKCRIAYPGICFACSRISYYEVLRKIAASRCILELCAKSQDGLTMRFYEAVFYNKLLITNNKTALQSQLYDEKYMQVVNNCDEIDIQKLKNTTDVNYDYHDEFSPVQFALSLTKYN